MVVPEGWMAAGDAGDAWLHPRLEAKTFFEVVTAEARLPQMVASLSVVAPAGYKFLRSMGRPQAFLAIKRFLHAGTSLSDLGLPESKTQEDLSLLLNYVGLRLLQEQDAEVAAKAAAAQADIAAAVSQALAASKDRGAATPPVLAETPSHSMIPGAGARADPARARSEPSAKRPHLGAFIPFTPAGKLSEEAEAIIGALHGRPSDGGSGEYHATDGGEPIHALLATFAPGMLSGTAALSLGVFVDAFVNESKRLGAPPIPMETIVEARRLLTRSKTGIHQYAQVALDPPADVVAAVITTMAEVVAAFSEAPFAALHWMMVARLYHDVMLADCPRDYLNLEALMRARAVACKGDEAALQALYDTKAEAYRSAVASMITEPRELRRNRAEFIARRALTLQQVATAGPASSASLPARSSQAAAPRGSSAGQGHRSARPRWDPSRDDAYGARTGPLRTAYREEGEASAWPGKYAVSGDLARGGNTYSGRQADHTRAPAPNVCRDFNGERGCTREVCRFPHVCSVCLHPNNKHPRVACPIKH